MKKPYRARQARGFTLIELMITVAIIAIISSIAIPSYTEYVKRGKRAEARSALLEAAAKMERYYSDENRYESSFTVLGIEENTQNNYYRLSITLGATKQEFWLVAIPTILDKCGSYTFNNRGEKGNIDNTETVKECWRK
ncbi:MAG: type IV pilin protein [Candidatus Eutrophobiaceae bacterium]